MPSGRWVSFTDTGQVKHTVKNQDAHLGQLDRVWQHMPIIPACGRLRHSAWATRRDVISKQSTLTSESTLPSIHSGILPRTPECQKTIALNASNLYVRTHKGNGLYLSAKHVCAMAAASTVWSMPVKLVQLSLSFKILQTEDSFLSQTSVSQHSIELLFLD